MTDPSTTHPWFTAAVAGVTMGVAGLAHEVPSRLPSWSLTTLFSTLLRRKEQLPMSTQFETALGQLNGILKVAVKILPGTTRDEKSAAVAGWLDPLLKQVLEQHGVTGELETAVVSLFNMAATALVAAEFT